MRLIKLHYVPAICCTISSNSTIVPWSGYCNSDLSTKPGRFNGVLRELRGTRGARFQALALAQLLNDSFVKSPFT